MNYKKNLNDKTSNEYSQKSRFKRLFNHVIDERLIIKFEKEAISIIGRKGVLDRFDSRFGYNQNV